MNTARVITLGPTAHSYPEQLIEDIKKELTPINKRMLIHECVNGLVNLFGVTKESVEIYDVTVKWEKSHITIVTAVSSDIASQFYIVEPQHNDTAPNMVSVYHSFLKIPIFYSFDDISRNRSVLPDIANRLASLFIKDDPKLSKYRVGDHARHYLSIKKGIYAKLRKSFLYVMIEKYLSHKPSELSILIKNNENVFTGLMYGMASIVISPHVPFLKTLDMNVLPKHLLPAIIRARDRALDRSREDVAKVDNFINTSKLFRHISKIAKTTDTKRGLIDNIILAAIYDGETNVKIDNLIKRLNNTRLEHITALTIVSLMFSDIKHVKHYGSYLYNLAMMGKLQDKNIRKALHTARAYDMVGKRQIIGFHNAILSIFVDILQATYNSPLNVKENLRLLEKGISSNNLSLFIKNLQKAHVVLVRDSQTPRVIEKIDMLPLPKELSRLNHIFLADTLVLHEKGIELDNCMGSYGSRANQPTWLFYLKRAAGQVTLNKKQNHLYITQCYGPHDRETKNSLQLRNIIEEVIKNVKLDLNDIEKQIADKTRELAGMVSTEDNVISNHINPRSFLDRVMPRLTFTLCKIEFSYGSFVPGLPSHNVRYYRLDRDDYLELPILDDLPS